MESGYDWGLKWDPHYVRPDGRVSMAEKWAAEHAQQEAERQQKARDALADAKAVWVLADYLVPTDFKEKAAALDMEETMKELWRNAFIAGWRARDRAEEKD